MCVVMRLVCDCDMDIYRENTMQNLTTVCFLCLTSDKKITSHCYNYQKVNEELRYIFPEQIVEMSKISKRVCIKCAKSLNNFYNFRKKCIENMTTFNEFAQKLIEESNSQMYRRIHNNVANTNEKPNCDITIKTEMFDTSFIKSETEKTGSTNKNIDSVITNSGGSTYNEYNNIQVKEEILDEDNDNVKPQDFEEILFVKNEVKNEIMMVETDEEENSSEICIVESNETQTYNISDDDSPPSTPPDLRKLVENVNSELLPARSRKRYTIQYELFKKWCSEKSVKIYSENVLLAYFSELVSSNKKSLWTIYSMLKSCMILHENVDISKYNKLKCYLKKKHTSSKPKRSKILEEKDINKFIEQAPDEKFLLIKVVLIIGVSGACRREELYKMALKDIESRNNIIQITIPVSKFNIGRSFVIYKKRWIETVQKYLKIRTKNTEIEHRLFLKYIKGKCVNIPLGINMIGLIPSKIAEFLNLENPKDFTGHCFRRSSVNRAVETESENLSSSQIATPLRRKIEIPEEGTSTSKLSAIANNE